MAANDPGRRPLSLLVVGDDPLARSGLALLLAREPGLEVVAELPASDDLASAIAQGEPRAVVWDVGPRAAASDLGRLRDLDAYRLPAVALVADEEAAADAFAAGARGLLFRDSDPGRIGSAARAVAAGLVALDETLAGFLLRPPPALLEMPVDGLTPRELEVLQHLALGLSNRQIADRLGISEHTAKFHVNAILTKLGAQTRTEGVVRAARLGLIIL